MSPKTLPVLIVGGGPAGLIAALWLAQNDIEVRIIDRAASFNRGSRGSGLQPRTFELFRALGIVDDVRSLATTIPTMCSYKIPGGTVPVKTWELYSKTGVWPDRPYVDGACLSQNFLQDILRRRLSELGIEVELNKGLVSLQQDEEKVIVKVLAYQNGEPTKETELISAHYIIGADGAKGITRKLLGLTFQGETRDADGMISGDVKIKNLCNTYWNMWAQPGRFTIMARPLHPETQVFGIGIIGQSFDPAYLNTNDKAEEFIKKETGREDLQFGDWICRSYYKPNMRVVNKFSEGRAFLVGDSAHVHAPAGGQGLNSAVQDSVNIAWKLALVIKRLASPALLESYSIERLPVIAQILSATSELYTHMIAKPKDQEDSLQKATEEEAISQKGIGFYRWRNPALQMYGVNYRYSPIILEERDLSAASCDEEEKRAHAFAGYEGSGTLCAGDRAPEAPHLLDCVTGEETGIFNLLGTSWHTVLVFGSDSEVLENLTEFPMELVKTYVVCKPGTKLPDSHHHVTALLDSTGYAHTAYRIKGESATIIIIRPDTFIGAIVKDYSGVERYFHKIFV